MTRPPPTAQVIVPLAGPDFFSRQGIPKALIKIDGEPLLLKALKERPWYKDIPSSNYSFVLYHRKESTDFAEQYLKEWFPNCKVIFISEFTQGAAFSTLAAVAITSHEPVPLIVDLGDILFRCEFALSELNNNTQITGGLAFVFESTSPSYSYLLLDEAGNLLQAAEKQRISSLASAGVYIFQSTSIFLRALAHSIEHFHTISYNDLLYVCPVLNGVVANGLNVSAREVSNVRDIKTDS